MSSIISLWLPHTYSDTCTCSLPYIISIHVNIHKHTHTVHIYSHKKKKITKFKNSDKAFWSTNIFSIIKFLCMTTFPLLWEERWIYSNDLVNIKVTFWQYGMQGYLRDDMEIKHRDYPLYRFWLGLLFFFLSEDRS